MRHKENMPLYEYIQYLCDCMSKTNFDISKQLYSDLIKAYCKACPGSWTMHDACAKAVKMPAPRFYVTPKQAYQVISRMVKGDLDMLEILNPLRRKMYYELFDVVMKLTERREFIGKSLWYIMPYAVTQPASEFFLNPHSLYCIRNDMKAGRISEEGKGRKHIARGKRRRV